MSFTHEPYEAESAPVALAGHTVVDAQLERVGKVTDVLFDDRAAGPRWAVVKIGMLGGEHFTIGHGDYLFLPRDVVHTFRNSTDEEARVISVVSPAGLERYYQALAELPVGPPDIAAIKEIMADFGLELRLPPQAG